MNGEIFKQLEHATQASKPGGDYNAQGYEELQTKMFMLEKRYLHLQRHIEKTGTISVDSGSQILKTDNSIMENEKLNAIEKRIGRKVAETVDSLGAIIKDYASKQNRLMIRISGLETKVFGTSKMKEMTKSRELNKSKDSSALRDSSARVPKRNSTFSPPVKDGVPVQKSKSRTSI